MMSALTETVERPSIVNITANFIVVAPVVSTGVELK